MIHIETPIRKIHNSNYICLGSKHKGINIPKSQIVYIEAAENYSWIHLSNGTKKLSTKPIGFHERNTVDNTFIRIHRSFLINNAYITLYESKYRLVHIKGEIILPVSFRKNRLLSKMIRNEELKIPLDLAI